MRTSRLVHVLSLAACVGTLAAAAPARADGSDPQSFIEHEHQKLSTLLREPPSAARDAQINAALDGFVDFDDLVHRSFGEPCHVSMPGCDDLWAKYGADRQPKLHALLKQVIEQAYRHNLKQTLDYDVTYKGAREAGGDTRVLTEAKSKTDARQEPVRIDYIVRQTPKGPRVVDIVTEGSSFSKNLYVQFRKLDDPDKIVEKLNEKLAKKD